LSKPARADRSKELTSKAIDRSTVGAPDNEKASRKRRLIKGLKNSVTIASICRRRRNEGDEIARAGRHGGEAASDRSQASSGAGPDQYTSGDREISFANNFATRRRLAPVTRWAEGQRQMRHPPPQQWTEAEVRRLRMLAKRKVSADNIAKSLGRYVGSVKIKARELGLILSKKLVRPSGKKPT